MPAQQSVTDASDGRSKDVNNIQYDRSPPNLRPAGTQVWAPLIEKAVAKLHGCYESLGRGSIEQGLRCLTGEAVLRIPLNESTSSGGGGGDVLEEAEATTKRREGLWFDMKR